MNVVVIGGGAGGMMSAGVAGSLGHNVTLLERNEKLGKKLYITGKGRCNVTNACSAREFLDNVIHNNKFLMGAINTFSPDDTIDFCEKYGCHIKIERGNRVFPDSDKSIDVINALERFMRENRVRVKYDSRVEEILVESGAVTGVKLDRGNIIPCDKVILASGGKSYPGTGSTGDGYALARRLGHNIIDIRPALVGIDTIENMSDMAGVSLKNVTANIVDNNGKVLYSDFGEMLFTHTGVSGPIILSLSSRINYADLSKLSVSLDLKPALDDKTLDSRIISDFAKYSNKELKNALPDLLISALRPLVIAQSGINPDKKVNVINKEERLNLARALKALTFGIKGLGAMETAIVTAGGVDVREISPKDMSSKLIKGLAFAGEVMDIDALTGGYNIQIALSTGYIAGKGCGTL